MNDNLPSKQEIWDPSPDGRQLYEPKMVAHICFMSRIYLELHLKSLLKQNKILKRVRLGVELCFRLKGWVGWLIK